MAPSVLYRMQIGVVGDMRRKRLAVTRVRDWEEQLSCFLQDAINNPDQEPEICEKLIAYVQFLVQLERNASRRAFSNMLDRLSEAV